MFDGPQLIPPCAALLVAAISCSLSWPSSSHRCLSGSDEAAARPTVSTEPAIFCSSQRHTQTNTCRSLGIINIALCLLGYIPGLVHSWYIISKYPEDEYEYFDYESQTYRHAGNTSRAQGTVRRTTGGGNTYFNVPQQEPQYRPQQNLTVAPALIPHTPINQQPQQQHNKSSSVSKDASRASLLQQGGEGQAGPSNYGAINSDEPPSGSLPPTYDDVIRETEDSLR